jgi:dienelactone hydrolase
MPKRPASFIIATICLATIGTAVVSTTASAAASLAAGRRYIDQVFTSVNVTKDVTYATAPSLNDSSVETLLLDLYSPAGDTITNRPVIVFIHGGGFKGGNKSNDVTDATDYAKRGFVTVSINYRLATDNVCQELQDGKLPPDQAAAAMVRCEFAITSAQHDAEAAIRYIRGNASSLGVDPTKVATIGFSAGAVTAANLAYRAEDPGDIGDFDGFDSTVQAAIAASGCEYEPTTIGAGDAPMFFLHAEFDGAVPFACAVANAASARAAGLPVETMFYFGESTHARSLYLKYQADVDARWVAFLGRYLGLDGAVPAGTQTIIHGTPNRSGVVSLVMTENSAPGFLQVLPCGSTPGGSSNLNADRPNQTRAGLAIVHFDNDGEACLFNQTSTHLVADLQGYFATGAVDDVADVRLADTRIDASGGAAPRLAAHTETQLTGRPNSTAIVSLVVTDTAGPGFVQMLPCGSASGGSSNVNADRAGETIANLAFVHFDSSGHVCVFNQTSAHIVADLQAYLTAGTFDDVADVRALDTRLSGGIKPSGGTQTTVVARASSTAVVSLVATAADGPGFVQALSCGGAAGGSSNLNVDEAGQTIANLAFVQASSGGTFCLYNQTATHLVADLQGYLQPGSFDDIADIRLLDTRPF